MSSRHRRFAPVLLVTVFSVCSVLSAQGTASHDRDPFARGKPMSEWLIQARHYIPEMRREAVKALAAMGPEAADAVPTLIKATRDDNAEVRYWAVEGLRRMGPAAKEAGPALLLVLADDQRPAQEVARQAIEAIGPAAVPLLLNALADRDPWVRSNAAEALGVLGGGRERKKVVHALGLLLVDDTLRVRASAAWAVGKIGPEAKDAAKPLVAALREEIRRDPNFAGAEQRTRMQSMVFALGALGPKAADGVPALMTVLNDGSEPLQVAAATALAGIGEPAVKPLGTAVQSPVPAVRQEAARALRLIGPKAEPAVPALIQVLENTDELEGGHDAIIAVADALGEIGKKAKKALSALEKQAKKSGSEDVTTALRRAIRKIRTGA